MSENHERPRVGRGTRIGDTILVLIFVGIVTYVCVWAWFAGG